MAEKYRNKYRIQSHRLSGWDYSASGSYFITLVVQGRRCVLGEIENKKMILNEWGEIVVSEWNKSFEMRKELFCDVFVIMPNHLHAIVRIEKHNDDVLPAVETHGRFVVETHGRFVVETHGRASLHRKPKSISSFIGGYKSAINTAIDNAIDAGIDLFPELGKFNKYNHFWQSNYYDHVIRNPHSYQRIYNYILANPENWKDDTFYNS